MNKSFLLFILSFFYTIELPQVDVTKYYINRSPSSFSEVKKKIVKKDNIIIKKNNIKTTKTIYKNALKYPPDSYLIDSKTMKDPSLLAYKKDIKTYILNDNTQVKAWSEKNYYESRDKKANFYIQLITQDTNGEFNPEIVSKLRNSNRRVKFERVSSNLFKGSITTDELKYGDHQLMINLTLNGDEFNTVNSFSFRKRYIESIEIRKDMIDSTGNLRVSFNAEVLVAGNYFVQTSLYFNGKPIGLVEKMYSVDIGVHELDLEFYGKVLYDTNKSGEFEIKHFRISYIETGLHMINLPKIETNYFTNSYHFDQFHNNSYNDPVILNKLSKLKD